jgi:hypothetical protein
MAKKKTSLVDAAKRLQASRDGSAKEESGTKEPASSGKKTTTTRKSSAGPAKKSETTKKKSTASRSSSKGTSARSGTNTRKSTPAKKSTGTKKSASTKKSEPTPEDKSVAVRSDNPRDQIIAEVVEIARELDDEGLDLLLNQAKVVRYKGQVEEFNRQLNTAAAKAADRRREANTPEYHVAVERNDDYFIIQMDDQRVFFNLQEMREITAISHKAKDPAAGARLLFRWFEQERSDLLADAGINSARNPYLFELYEIIVSTYKVKQ